MHTNTYFEELESPQYKLAKQKIFKLMIILAFISIFLAFAAGILGGMAGSAIKR